MLGIGIDCVLISRIKGLMLRRLDPYSFPKRILSLNEYNYFTNIFRDTLSTESVSFLAGRFALKEASFKALSSSSTLKSKFSFKHVETSYAHGTSCPPSTTYLPSNLPLLTSLTHDGGIVIAIAFIKG